MTFSNITKEPPDDWIGEGIAETVTADLKKIEGLAVVGRAQIFDAVKNLSSGGLAGIDERLAIDVGRRIGARWIVGGGYQRIGDIVRITAHFIDVGTGALVQTVKVDGQIGEIFALQDRIVYELSRGLNLQLAHSEIEGIETDETRSVEAYEAYSRGVMNLRMAGRDSIDRAIYLFEKAIEHDPEYPAAWARLGEAYGLKGGFLSIPELVAKGLECVRRAVALNPRFAMARVLLGAGLAASGQVDEGIAELQEAIRLDPNNAGAIEDLGRVYWLRKGAIDQGITELERAVELNPEGGYAYLQLGLLYALKGDYARAEAACRAAIDLQEQYISGKEGLLIVGAHTRLGYVYYRQGRYDEAIRAYERELAFLSSSDHVLRDRSLIEVNQKLGAAYLRKGMGEEAERYFQRALKGFDDRLARGADDPFTRYYIATLHALRGEAEPAVRSLRETLGKLPALTAPRVRTDPDFDAIREHPLFIEVIQKVEKSKS
jgi:tetratricopeptide (TPR) repeat protein